jgi:peptidoglycan/LPS O-acetylase OafA/YrhL
LKGRLVHAGRSGVSFFYILSGFVLTYNYRDWFQTDTKRWASFASARMARVYPMYLASVFFALPLVLWEKAHFGAELSAIAHSSLAPRGMALSFIANTLCLQPLLPTPEVHLLWSSVNWSIPCELFFYACFPFLMVWLCSRKLSRPAMFQWAAGIYVAEVVLFSLIVAALSHFWSPQSLLGRVTQTRYLANDLLAYRAPWLRIGEFAVGVLIGLIYLKEQDEGIATSKHRNALVIVLCLASVSALACIQLSGVLQKTIDWLQAFGLFTPFYAALVLSIARGATGFSALLSYRPVELLGEASYSLYLLHTLPLTVLNIANTTGHVFGYGTIIMTVAATILLSIGTFTFLETPTRRAWRRWTTRQRFAVEEACCR